MINFFMTYWDSIMFALLFIGFILFLLHKGYVKQANEILFYLVTQAEKEFGGGTGQLKYAAVTTWLYEKLPAIAKILLTSDQIDILIESAVLRMKEYLDNNMQARAITLKK